MGCSAHKMVGTRLVSRNLTMITRKRWKFFEFLWQRVDVFCEWTHAVRPSYFSSVTTTMDSRSLASARHLFLSPEFWTMLQRSESFQYSLGLKRTRREHWGARKLPLSLTLSFLFCLVVKFSTSWSTKRTMDRRQKLGDEVDRWSEYFLRCWMLINPTLAVWQRGRGLFRTITGQETLLW